MPHAGPSLKDLDLVRLYENGSRLKIPACVYMHVFIVCLSGYEYVHMCLGAYGNQKRA